MKRGPRTLTVVTGVLLVLAVLYLAVSAFLSRPQQTGAAFSAEGVGTAPETQRRALADGVVTLPELEAAWEAHPEAAAREFQRILRECTAEHTALVSRAFAWR